MQQNDLNRAVARATGETVSTIKQRGFTQEQPDRAAEAALTAYWEARCIDWDAEEEFLPAERLCCETA